jgi:site-specific DNA-methyltransferase (adenine-specific)
MIRLYNQCCLEAMAGMKDKAFELAIVDPPYGIGVNSMNMGSRQTVRPDNRKWDDTTPPPEYFEELQRVSINQVIWGGNYFILPPSRCFIIWDKGEAMYRRDFAECEQAWTSFDKVARIFKMHPVQLGRIHPTQKPVSLYKWILKNYAKPGDKILDTHGGSGSIAIACHDMGFDLDLYEIDKEYFEAGKERLERHQRQGMFEL